MVHGNHCSLCDGEMACEELHEETRSSKKHHKDKLALILFLVIIPLFAIIFFDLIRSI